METLTLADLDRDVAAFDDSVAATPDIDQFCSSSSWILPAADALMPPRTPWLARGDHGWVALMQGERDGWSYLEPLEAMWGLACPLVGQYPERLAAEFAAYVTKRAAQWRVMLLTGIPNPSRLALALAQELSRRFVLRPGGATVRCVADLAGGVDGFLSRRSRNFRKSLTKTLRAADRAGLTFERARIDSPAEADALYERILAVERRSWKGRAGAGIDHGRMCTFYRVMIARLAVRGNLRVLLARADADGQPRDVAYVLGATFGATYRGLQFSFDHDYEALGLGNLCQYHEIVALCADGFERYDLGTDMLYKRRWAELRHRSLALIALQR